jgi:hypothetical protein
LSPCGGPTGIAYDAPNKRLFTGCRTNKGMSVVDAVSGASSLRCPSGQELMQLFMTLHKADLLLEWRCYDHIIKQESADSYKVIQTLATQFVQKQWLSIRRRIRYT